MVSSPEADESGESEEQAVAVRASAATDTRARGREFIMRSSFPLLQLNVN